MADRRTAEQKAAEEHLRQALEGVARAYEYPGLLTDAVCVVALQHIGDDGLGRTNVCTLLPGRETAYHRVMGLLDFALTRYRLGAVEDDDEDDDGD